MLKTHDFYYDLPEELIAQTPLERRDASRLMTLDRKTGEVTHRHFYDLLELLQPGDCLVMNNSRVLPARLLGHRVPTGGAVEVLLLKDQGNGVWECLTKPGRKTHTGTELSFGDGDLTATVVGERDDGNKLVQFHYEGIFLEVLERLGKMPLPPYIKEELQDGERYQTVYSKINGSAAAPTAGLHFTQELLDKLAAKGVKEAYITLHVGLGTFRPVKAAEITEHHMHSEFCMISKETADIINETKRAGGRIVCEQQPVDCFDVRVRELGDVDGLQHCPDGAGADGVRLRAQRVAAPRHRPGAGGLQRRFGQAIQKCVILPQELRCAQGGFGKRRIFCFQQRQNVVP